MSAALQHPVRATTVMLRWRPEWPYLVLTFFAWVALLTGVSSHAGRPPASHNHRQAESPVPAAPDHRHTELKAPELHDREHHQLGPTAVPAQRARHDSASPPGALTDWMLMSVAMMVPVVLPAVRHVGLNSIRRRRQWAMLLFMAVYLAVWAAFGIVALNGRRLALETLGIDAPILFAVALAVAAGWQLTRVKRRALLACRRTVPLPPVGRRADAGCARFALQQGRRCVASCWALMAVTLTVQQAAMVWMLSLTTLMAAEELTRPGQRGQRLTLSATALATAAGIVAVGTQPWWSHLVSSFGR